MECALRDMLTAMGIVTLNRTLTSIGGTVEKNASGSPNNVMGLAQRKELSAETTCASAKLMIPNAMGLPATTIESVTAPA